MRILVQKGFFTSKIGLTILGVVFAIFLAVGGVFTYYYMKYSRMIDARLSGNVLQNTTQIFSAPEHISPGQAWGPDDLTGYLTRVGYRPLQDENALGQFTVRENTVDIRPSKLSYFGGNNALAVQFRGKSIRSIKPLAGGTELDTAEIEPELITNLFDSAREKRRAVRYEIRIVGAAWADVRHTSQHYQGASTITMQVARTFFLSTERNWRRKLAEAMISVELEQRFNKQQIFELYANEVYLGNRGSFGIRGFSEASVAYFGKDLRQLTLPECAYLRPRTVTRSAECRHATAS